MSPVSHMFPKNAPNGILVPCSQGPVAISMSSRWDRSLICPVIWKNCYIFFSSNCIPDVLLHLERATPNVAQENRISESQGPSKHKVISSWNNPPALEVAFGVAWKGTQGSPCQVYAGTQISGHLTTLPMSGLAGDPCDCGMVAPAEGPGRWGGAHPQATHFCGVWSMLQPFLASFTRLVRNSTLTHNRECNQPPPCWMGTVLGARLAPWDCFSGRKSNVARNVHAQTKWQQTYGKAPAYNLYSN